jgi:uncharacterized membrane protein YkvA (DUF1232 family)
MLLWLSRLRRIATWRRFIKDILEDASTLWFAWRHPGTPLWIKCVSILLPAYLFSPIDIIPEFLLLLGILDDLVIVPMGVRWVVGRLPNQVREESRLKAKRLLGREAKS